MQNDRYVVDKYGLTKQMRAFVKEYIVDYSGTKAAIRAGYSKKTANPQASRLLAKVSIQDAIKREEQKLQNRYHVTKERILRELAIIGFSDIDDYMTVTEDGTVQINTLKQLPLSSSKAIKTIKEKKKTMQVGGEMDISVTDVQTEFTLHDKIAALQLMGKEICMFKDKVAHELTGKDGGPIKVEDYTDEQLLLIIARAGGNRNVKAKAIKGKPA
jgi:phage terminase small subunit